jgi:hypothetical protein
MMPAGLPVLLAILLFSQLLSYGVEKKTLPYRWVMVRTGLKHDGDVEKIRVIAKTASQHGLNGLLLGAGLDTIDLALPDYLKRLQAVKSICVESKLELIPSIFTPGYGGGLLEHDRNLAEGMPVENTLFVVRNAVASLVPDLSVALSNGGFENADGSTLSGFELSGGMGQTAFQDSSDFREGKVSLRLDNFGSQPGESIRLSQWVKVQPRRLYRLSCEVKARDLKPSEPFGESGFQLEVYGGEERRPLQYENPPLASDDDWHRVAVAFNSWGYDKVLISPVVNGGGKGRFWIDDLKLEEIALVNVLRRPGTPLTVKGEKSGRLYLEGRDFRYVADPLMDFHFDHPSPSIQLLPGSRIQEGERLRIGFYHSVFIYNDQIPVCMAEPKAYEIWREQIRLLEAALGPHCYFLNADEHRALGTCQACRKSGMTLGQIQADCVTRQHRMIRELNPQAEIFVWSDMFDPHHNAGNEKRWYYLTEGSFADSWKLIPKDLIMVCWYFERREASLKHFSGLGFKTMAGAYYDADNLDNPKAWLESLEATPGAMGILYTTWLDKYDLLGPFGDLVTHRK